MSRLRAGIIGTGFGRTVQAVAFGAHPGFELVAIAGSDADKTRRIAAESGIANGYGDWREMIERESLDLVSVAAPPDLHHPMMLAALERGCHVLCEKPTAFDRLQAAEMRSKALAAGRVAAINHEFRFLPARREALAHVREGAIGEPRRVEILGRYALWTTPASRGFTWLSDRRRGGGILGALGSHHTDCIRTFLGEPERVIASVRVDQPWRGPTADRPQREVATADDACTVMYEFDSGASALMDLDATAPYRWERFEVRGADATLRWDESGEQLWRLSPGKEAEALEIREEFRLARREGEPMLVAPFGVLLGRLHHAISNGSIMEPNFDDALAVQCVLDAARFSSDLGAMTRIERAH
jgi:predicted dehydrogenase